MLKEVTLFQRWLGLLILNSGLGRLGQQMIQKSPNTREIHASNGVSDKTQLHTLEPLALEPLGLGTGLTTDSSFLGLRP